MGTYTSREASGIKCLSFIGPVRGDKFSKGGPPPQKLGLESSQSDINANQPDSPAQNETTRLPVRAISPQCEVLMKRDEEILMGNKDEVNGKNKASATETEGRTASNENSVKPGGEATKSFDPLSLRLSQDYAALAATKKIITTIPITKPNRWWFCRVHREWSFEVAILEVEDGSNRRESYVVTLDLVPELSLEIKPKVLFVAINRQGSIFLWPIKLPGEDGGLDAWNQSVLMAAERAKTCWIRLVANMGIQAYDLHEAQGDLPEPKWPTDLNLKKILEIAFNGRVIDSLDHPVLRRLRGEL